MLVVGDREAADGTVAVRHRVSGDLGSRAVEEFISAALTEIRDKKVPEAVSA
jgi:threonyl-tRNA synthetase